MDRVVNVALLRNPYNWIVVALMLAIGVVALAILEPVIEPAFSSFVPTE